MRLEKKLLIDKFTTQRCSKAPYVIEAISGEHVSKLNIDKDILHHKLNIENPIIVSDKQLQIVLESREMKKGPDRCITDLTRDDLVINEIGKNEIQKRRGLSWIEETGAPCFHASDSLDYFVNLKTFDFGGGHFTSLPCPYYDLKLSIDEREYNQLKQLPENAVMVVKDLKLVD